MTRPGIEPRSPGPLANTLPTRTNELLINSDNKIKFDILLNQPANYIFLMLPVENNKEKSIGILNFDGLIKVSSFLKKLYGFK